MTGGQLHRLLGVSLLMKGAHAVLECIGGVLLAFVPTSAFVTLVGKLTQDELYEDPHDFIATHLATFAQGFSVSTQHFYAFYLLSHGVVKLFLVVVLLRGKLWAYPLALVTLALFVVYQLYRFSYTHSAGLIALSVFDLFVMAMIWAEYRTVRRRAF